MIFDSAGTALQGITGNEVAETKGGFDYNRRVEYIIPHKEVSSGKCVRYIEVSANGMFGAGPQDDVRVSLPIAMLTRLIGRMTSTTPSKRLQSER
jgi:hypothetical protein